jgi:hypothetical protein
MLPAAATLLLLFPTTTSAAAFTSYGSFNQGVTSNEEWHGQQVVHLTFSDQADEAAMHRALGAANITDLWRHDHSGRAADVVVPAAEVQRLRALPGVANLSVTVQDLGVLVLQSMPSQSKVRWTRDRPLEEFFDEWRDNAEVELWSLALCERHPLRCSFTPSIGESVEGRPIFALSMGGTTGGPAVYHQVSTPSCSVPAHPPSTPSIL